MTDTLRQRACRFARANFPERQIYIRSEGRVQFFTLTPIVQAVMAGAGLLVLGWVAFTSVTTVFKDRILAVKEMHFRDVQRSYESRLAELQLSYDQLNRALVAAESRFRSAADTFEARHKALASIVDGKASLESSLGVSDAPAPVKGARNAKSSDGGVGGPLDSAISGYSLGLTPPATAEQLAPQARRTPQQPAAKALERHSMLEDPSRQVQALAAPASSIPAFDRAAFRSIQSSEARLQQLRSEEDRLLAKTQTAIEQEDALYEKAIRTAGIDPKNILARAGKAESAHGPVLPISFTPGAGEFEVTAAKARASLDGLADVVTALRSVPLSAPVAGAPFDESSGFGVRRDPFTNRLSFHSGLDFSGPLGSPIRSTAPGIVVFAGVRGAYGNTVEIDHGFGVRTRYGHLQRILVQVGSQVQKGAIIGKLGTSGRSTGPHVHYEVWYDSVVKNPSNFLKAGQYVFQAEGT